MEEKTGQTNSNDSKKKAVESPEYIFDKDKPYPFESGIIEYKYTGDYSGRQTVYFNDYGKKLRVEDDYIITGAPLHTKVSRLFIQTDSKYYDLDLVAKKGYYIQRTDTTAKLQGNLVSDFTTLGIDSAMHKNGYRRAGDTTISEKKCRLYRSKDGKSEFCFWQGMNIKTDMRFGQSVTYRLEAIKVHENVAVPDDKFVPPTGVKIMDYKIFVKTETRDKL